MLGLPTLLATFSALLLASLLGPLLGRLATQWFSGRGLTNLLTEVRGAFLPFLVAPLLVEWSHWPTWLVIGVITGVVQGISVGRWIARRTGEWSPSLLGGIALGRSRAALLSARATARGAVIGTLSLTLLQVILLEALLTALKSPGLKTDGTVGAALIDGAGAETLFIFALGAAVILASELGTSWLFQRRPRTGAK